MLVLSVRPAVNTKQERHFRPFHVSDRIGQQAVDLSTVGARKSDILGRRQVKLDKELVVLVRKLTEFAVLERIDLVRFRVATRDQCDTILCPTPGSGYDRRRQQLFDDCSRLGRTSRIDRAVIGHEKVNEFAIQAEVQVANTAVEVLGRLDPRGSRTAV